MSVIIPGMVPGGGIPHGNLEFCDLSLVRFRYCKVVKYAQGLKTVFGSPRTSSSRQKMSCTVYSVLVYKVKHLHFCCVICEFIFFC